MRTTNRPSVVGHQAVALMASDTPPYLSGNTAGTKAASIHAKITDDDSA